MIRVGDLTEFTRLPAGEVATFKSDRARNVRLVFNAPHRTVVNVHALTDDGTLGDNIEPMFLARVDGLQTVEFFAHGMFAIECDADVWLKTFDGNAIHAVVPDAEAFVRISERRARNPEVEALQMMLQRNLERRMGAMYEEARRDREAMLAEFRATVDSAEGAAGGDSEAPEPGAGAGESPNGTAPDGA